MRSGQVGFVVSTFRLLCGRIVYTVRTVARAQQHDPRKGYIFKYKVLGMKTVSIVTVLSTYLILLTWYATVLCYCVVMSKHNCCRLLYACNYTLTHILLVCMALTNYLKAVTN